MRSYQYPFIVSAWRCASIPRPRRNIETIVTRTTETAIDRLRRRPEPTSESRKRNCTGQSSVTGS
jgi:hypothetical protein